MDALHVVGVVLEPMQVPAFGLIMGQKSVSGSPTGSPTAIDRMLEFSALHASAPITETFPMRNLCNLRIILSFFRISWRCYVPRKYPTEECCMRGFSVPVRLGCN
jgi:D-arabinose 1-dehydrogenase-like Zn-dependent alcohol dehydrogenase